MFENLFLEGIQARNQKLNCDTKRATEEYNRVKERNPNMLEKNTNYIDFSDPSSVARYQGLYNRYNNTVIVNPYKYNNPYLNPNIIPGTINNPYSYNSSYYGNWFGINNYYNAVYDTTKYMLATDEDIKQGKLTRGFVTDTIVEEEPTENHISYFDNFSIKNIEIRVETITETFGENPTNVYEQNGIKYTIEKVQPKEHLPNTPFTIEELNQDSNQIKIITNTPLNWSSADEEELSKLCDDLAVFDKALAHLMWNIPFNNNNPEEGVSTTREEYNYYKIYCRNLIQDYKSQEIMNPSIDYRAPYRYRPLPTTYTNADGKRVVDLTVPFNFARKRFDVDLGRPVYEYDRGRDDLTQEEWQLFLDRAFEDLMEGCKKLQGIDLLKINTNSSQLQEINFAGSNSNVKYNPYDPISVKLYNMKQAEKTYYDNMNFYRYVFRNSMTEEQFNNWWYGTKSNAQRVQNSLDPEKVKEQQLENWKRQMTEENMKMTNYGRLIDPVGLANNYNNNAYKAITNYTKGIIKPEMSAADFMQTLPYLDNRIHEMNVNNQIAYYRNNRVIQNNKNSNMFKHMMYEFHNNDNPYYKSPYGPTIDSRMGIPSIIQDYTTVDRNAYYQKRSKFMASCNQMKDFPLNQAGGIK